MKTNVKGLLIDATVVDGTGYADLFAVLDAYGIPYKKPVLGTPQVALRAFAVALGQPHQFVQADDVFYIASKPLPALPTDPVGAGVEPWLPVTAPICGGPGDRRADLLDRIIRQFHVDHNPRHVPRQGNTYCNIYVWDVTRALGAEIPHWVIGDGEPSTVGRGRELDANSVVLWLRRSGPNYGWRKADVVGVMAAANSGRPAVAVWLNQGGIGHVAMVRPGQADSVRGVPIAQAGARNFDDGYLVDGFGSRAAAAVEYYIHD